MKKHTKIYLNHFGYGLEDFMPCEVCGERCVDVHHINGRGNGKDVIQNLIGLCRSCHDRAHGLKEPKIDKELLIQIRNHEQRV